MKAVYDSILDLVGETPILKLNRVVGNSPHRFYAKLEYFNPGQSVKDRLAMAIIDDAEKSGKLKPGGTVVEATSGNTGMGLALAAAVKGYKAVFVMPEKISEEKRAILRAFGAEVVITPTGLEPDDPGSHYSVARRIAEERPNGYLCNQYHNPANAQIHYEKTGPEIYQQMDGKIDVFVAGAGTGGTISGVGRYLKERNAATKVVCADPIGSILFDLFYSKKVITPPAPYLVEGVGEDMLPENVHLNMMDDFVQFNDKEAFQMTRDLTRFEGICVGPSSGGALVAAMRYSERFKEPKNFLIMMPDHGRAYLSKTFNDAWLKSNNLV